VAAETVVVERQGSVLRVRMNRPDKLHRDEGDVGIAIALGLPR
jgi:hypothetical protein